MLPQHRNIVRRKAKIQTISFTGARESGWQSTGSGKLETWGGGAGWRRRTEWCKISELINFESWDNLLLAASCECDHSKCIYKFVIVFAWPWLLLPVCKCAHSHTWVCWSGRMAVCAYRFSYLHTHTLTLQNSPMQNVNLSRNESEMNTRNQNNNSSNKEVYQQIRHTLAKFACNCFCGAHKGWNGPIDIIINIRSAVTLINDFTAMDATQVAALSTQLPVKNGTDAALESKGIKFYTDKNSSKKQKTPRRKKIWNVPANGT